MPCIATTADREGNHALERRDLVPEARVMGMFETHQAADAEKATRPPEMWAGRSCITASVGRQLWMFACPGLTQLHGAV
jgi:hypothetical protein